MDLLAAPYPVVGNHGLLAVGQGQDGVAIVDKLVQGARDVVVKDGRDRVLPLGDADNVLGISNLPTVELGLPSVHPVAPGFLITTIMSTRKMVKKIKWQRKLVNTCREF